MKVRDIPEFKIGDIMGQFEVDDDGNFIIGKGRASKAQNERLWSGG